MNADALRGTLTGDDAGRPTIDGAAYRLACADAVVFYARRLIGTIDAFEGALVEVGGEDDPLVFRDSHEAWVARGDMESAEQVLETALRAYEAATPPSVGRAGEDAAARHPQGASGP